MNCIRKKASNLESTGYEAFLLCELFSYFSPSILAGDKAQAGTAIPADVDRTHIVHPADGTLAARDQLPVIGIVHINQFHPSAHRILLTQLL